MSELNSTIKIVTSDNCKVYIEDISNYIEEGKPSGENEFKFSDTVSIDFITYNKLQQTIHKDFVFSNHTNRDVIEIPIDSDGWFSIKHIILPSKKWFDRQLSNGRTSWLSSYDVVYYGDNKKVFKYIPGISQAPEEVSIGEILDLNLKARKYTIYSCYKDFVSICFLQKCYINLCQQIFNQRGFSPCWSKNSIDSELIYKRDLLWMALNVIKYLTQQHTEENPTLNEVERIIETINGCNGLCTSNTLNSNINGCGCSK